MRHVSQNIQEEHTEVHEHKVAYEVYDSLNDILRYVTNSTVTGYRINVVIGGRPAAIADSEIVLTRKTRVVLATTIRIKQ